MATRSEFHEAYFQSIDDGNTERAQRIADKLGYVPERDPEAVDTSLPEPTGSNSPLSVAGEFAAAANRNVMDTLDFLGPGSINAVLRLAGSDTQLPTFSGAFSQTPGAEGGFMPEGTARDVVQGAGGALPAAASLVSVPGRSLASARGAAEELLGFGSATPPARTAQGPLESLLFAGQEGPQAPMAARADELGFPISPGDRYDNRQLKAVESAIESFPMPANPMLRQGATRQRLMNEAAAESVGLPRRMRLTDDVVGDQAAELSGEFRRLGDLESLGETGDFVDDLVRIQDTSRSRLFKDPDIESTINKIFDKLDDEGALSVSDYQDVSSELKAKIRQAWKGESPDPYFAETLEEIVDSLDRLAIGSVEPADMERLRTARRRWRALTQLEKSRALRESGDVSGPLLANYLRRTDKPGYGRGGNRGRLYETARLTKAFPGRPDSGTAGRSYLNQLMQHPVSGGLGIALSPLSSTAANLYYYGPQAASRSAQRIGFSPGIPARVGGWLESDEESEADIPYLYPR